MVAHIRPSPPAHGLAFIRMWIMWMRSSLMFKRPRWVVIRLWRWLIMVSVIILFVGITSCWEVRRVVSVVIWMIGRMGDTTSVFGRWIGRLCILGWNAATTVSMVVGWIWFIFPSGIGRLGTGGYCIFLIVVGWHSAKCEDVKCVGVAIFSRWRPDKYHVEAGYDGWFCGCVNVPYG